MLTSASFAFTCVVLAAPAAHADDANALPESSARAAADLEEARRLTRDGLKLFQSQRYDEAIALFRSAYVLLPTPGLLYNLAQAQRLKGDCKAAVATYREFLLRDPHGPLGELARAHLASCQGDDETKAPPAPPPAKAPVDSPPEATSVTEPRNVSSALSPVSPARGLDTPARPHPARAAAVVSFASAGAWLAVGVYFGWRAQKASAEISGAFEEQNRWSGAAASIEDGGRRDENLAIAATVTGLVAAGIGVWLWTW
jgi:hypothetical protein